VTAAAKKAGDGRPLTLPAIMQRHAATGGEHILLACDGAQLSYAEAEIRSRSLARALIAAGVTKGSHVALLLPNSPEFIICALAASRVGAVILPLSTLSSADELRWLLANSDVNCLIAARSFRSRDFVELLRTAFPDLDFSRDADLHLAQAPWLRHIWFTAATQEMHSDWSIDSLQNLASTIDDQFLDAVQARVLSSDRLAIIHTSGSTSTPKGVMHTHGGLIGHLYNVNEVRRYVPGEALFSSSPWFWVAGFSYALLGTMIAGARLVVSNSTNSSEVLDQLERERPTITNGYPLTVAKLVDDPSFPARDLSSIRRGNLWPIMPDEVRARDPALRHNIYGMTEVGGVVTMSGDESDLPEQFRGSCGSVLPGFETRIVDPDTGLDCPAGVTGELWLRSPYLMEGYYGRSRSEVFEPDGWWRTGDLGSFDAAGFFYIAGRRGEMIKTSGANVAPREVEAVLQDIVGGRQCLVVGVPDELRGQLVVAVIVDEQNGAVDEEDIRRKAAERLSQYKIPRRVLRFSRVEIPMLSSGKVNMRELGLIAQQRCHAEDAQPTAATKNVAV
jgi:acyl-CoA synthetase (AMP-forming)/AMP-acid ligase II